MIIHFLTLRKVIKSVPLFGVTNTGFIKKVKYFTLLINTIALLSLVATPLINITMTASALAAPSASHLCSTNCKPTMPPQRLSPAAGLSLNVPGLFQDVSDVTILRFVFSNSD